MTLVLNLWRGRVPLAITGFLYGLLGLLLLVAPILYLHGTKSPLMYTPFMTGLSLFLLVYSAFIAISIWRSANNHRGAVAWRYVAKGSILFVAGQVVVGLI